MMMWIWLVATAAALGVHSELVVLLDSTKEATLDWTRFSYGDQSPGWLKTTDAEKQSHRLSYVVCDIGYQHVDNWLWIPLLERSNANRLYIEIKFTMRPCLQFPGNAFSCKEEFNLLFHEYDVFTREQLPWEPQSYKLVDRIAVVEERFNANYNLNINTEVKSVAVTKSRVYFAIRDQGACLHIKAVKVYYITCPEVTINFARFPATPTGREVTTIERVNGTCVDNAEPTPGETAVYMCKSDGKWTLPQGSCKCRAGFEPDNENQVCNECPPGKFKSYSGDCL